MHEQIKREIEGPIGSQPPALSGVESPCKYCGFKFFLDLFLENVINIHINF